MKTFRCRRGIADPVTLVLVVGLGLGYVFGSWKPLAKFRKKPPTEQLTKLQADLDKAKADAESARLAAEAAKVQERQALETQIRAAQADNVGTVTALKRAPDSPEVRLASRMAQRVSLKLATAIGKLPADQQEAMVELIEQALSDKQSEVDSANAKLAALDADFKAVTGEREALKAEIPKLTQRALKAEETAKAVQSEVTAKTEEVKTWANKANEALRGEGSLMESVKKGALVLFLAYGFFTFILPGLVKHLAADNPLKGLLRDATGYLTSPLLYHDAKTKLRSKGP